MRSGPYNFFDRCFENEINSLIEQTTAHFDATNYKSALKTGLFDFQNAKSWYREVSGGDVHRDLIVQFIEAQVLLIAPIAPHWSDYLWREVLKKSGSVQVAAFPKPSCPEDKAIAAAQGYVKSLSDAVHQAEGAQLRKKAKGKQSTFDPKKPKRLWIYVAKEFPAWQQKYIDALQELYDEVFPMQKRLIRNQIRWMKLV
jgi:leucyl-tRNA synthetase